MSAQRLQQLLRPLLLAALLPLAANAGELPAPAIPDSVGVAIHFTRGGEKDLDLIAAAGIKVVRMDFVWAETERFLGVYDWSAYDELAANLAKRGLRPLFILDYSNPLYEESVTKLWQNVWPYPQVLSPRQPRSIAAFANWAAAAARHFRKHKVIWEIWNEPNIKFWRPQPDVAEYINLALPTCAALREADADATVVAPAAAGLPWEFLESFFQAGALTCLDAVSVHPYRERQRSPETAADDYRRLRQLIDQYAPAEKKGRLPILSGEWGYATVRDGMPLQDQADYLVRMQLFNLLSDLPLSIWYDWKNDGLDNTNHEHNFGMVDAALHPKPAYVALKTMTGQLTGYRLIRRLPQYNADDYALLFGNAAGHGKIVAWTSGRAHDARIAAPPPPRPAQMTQTDGNGLRSAIRLDGAWIPLRLTSSPVYIAP